jgi:hypothetical protein
MQKVAQMTKQFEVYVPEIWIRTLAVTAETNEEALEIAQQWVSIGEFEEDAVDIAFEFSHYAEPNGWDSRELE